MEDANKIFTADNCDRCGFKLDSRIMSIMNMDIICQDCAAEEKSHPFFRKALEAELEEVKKGNRKYPGLFHGRQYPFAECSFPGCSFRVEEMLSAMSEGSNTLYFCPNHELEYIVKGCSMDQLTEFPSRIKGRFSCEICGRNAYNYHSSDIDVNLCEEHLFRPVCHNLEPDSWKKLSQKFPNAFCLHDDFYDEYGNPLQPEPLY